MIILPFCLCEKDIVDSESDRKSARIKNAHFSFSVTLYVIKARSIRTYKKASLQNRHFRIYKKIFRIYKNGVLESIENFRNFKKSYSTQS